MGQDRTLLYSMRGWWSWVSSLRYVPSKVEMSTLDVDFLHPPGECKLVIIPSYGSNGTYHMDNLISVTIDNSARVQVPREYPADESPLISLSVVYQIGPITNCIAGMNIPPEPEVVTLEFITTGCVTFLVPSQALGGSSANYSTLTVGELKYSPDSTTPDGILQKTGETVTGLQLPEGSIPYIHDQELKGAVIEGTSNQVEVAASYDGGTDTVALTLSLPQDISTTSSPEFQAVNLRPSTGSGAVTMTAASSVGSRTYQIPDTGSSSQFVMTTGDQSVDGKKTFSNLEVKGNLLPEASTGTRYIGTSSRGWQRLYISNEKKVGETTVKGGIALGHGIRSSDRGELFINSVGDNVADIFLGSGEAISANIKWGISSRASPGNELKIFRGPLLVQGDFKEALTIDATGAMTLASETDSTDTSTGGLVVKGGLGVAKTIHSSTVRTDSLYLSSPEGVPSPLSRYEKFTLQDTIVGPWNDPKPVTITVTIIGDQVIVDFPSGFYFTQRSWHIIGTTTNIIPPRIRPHVDRTSLIKASNADVWGVGTASVTSDGSITLHPDATHNSNEWNYISGRSTSWYAFSIMYTL